MWKPGGSVACNCTGGNKLTSLLKKKRPIADQANLWKRCQASPGSEEAELRRLKKQLKRSHSPRVCDGKHSPHFQSLASVVTGIS